jgi:hypothetical protein
MRVVQSFTEQDMMSFHRTLLDTMKSGTTYKATTSAEEKISVVRRKMRECVEGETVYSNGDRIGEHRTLVESIPMGIVVIGHWRLNYLETPPLILSFITATQSKRYHFWDIIRQREGQKESGGQTWDWPTLWGKARNAQGSAPTKY